MSNFVRLSVISEASGTALVTEGLKIVGPHATNVFMYGGTTTGDMYVGRVGDEIHYISLQSGATGIYGDDRLFQSYQCVSTSYSGIYETYVENRPAAWEWIVDLTNFATAPAMLQMFYDTYVEPDTGSTIYVRITAGDANSGGTSGPDYGNGSYSDDSDLIPIPGLPTLSAVNSGLINIFRPTLTQLQQLGHYLFTNITDFIENLQKWFSNPMDYFITFHVMPCVPDTGALQNVRLGLWDTGIQMAPVLSQWYEFDFGEITVSPYWGSALDYSPYTKMSLFLPFIGSVSLNTDEIMGNVIGLRYRFDLLSGSVVALLTINGSCWYQFTGEAAVTIPLTGADWSRIYSAAIGATTSIVSGIAGVAGAGSSMAGHTFAAAKAAEGAGWAGYAYGNVNATSKGVKGVVEMREQLLEAARNANNAVHQMASAGTKKSDALRAAAISNAINNVAGNVAAAKGIVSHTGSISSSAGMLGIRTPYILVEYPNQSLADNYNHYNGYPSNIYSSLSTLSGYTECESVLVSGINATESEIAEITEALKSGVYL